MSNPMVNSDMKQLYVIIIIMKLSNEVRSLAFGSSKKCSLNFFGSFGSWTFVLIVLVSCLEN